MNHISHKIKIMIIKHKLEEIQTTTTKIVLEVLYLCWWCIPGKHDVRCNNVNQTIFSHWLDDKNLGYVPGGIFWLQFADEIFTGMFRWPLSSLHILNNHFILFITLSLPFVILGALNGVTPWAHSPILSAFTSIGLTFIIYAPCWCPQFVLPHQIAGAYPFLLLN